MSGDYPDFRQRLKRFANSHRLMIFIASILICILVYMLCSAAIVGQIRSRMEAKMDRLEARIEAIEARQAATAPTPKP